MVEDERKEDEEVDAGVDATKEETSMGRKRRLIRLRRMARKIPFGSQIEEEGIGILSLVTKSELNLPDQMMDPGIVLLQVKEYVKDRRVLEEALFTVVLKLTTRFLTHAVITSIVAHLSAATK